MIMMCILYKDHHLQQKTDFYFLVTLSILKLIYKKTIVMLKSLQWAFFCVFQYPQHPKPLEIYKVFPLFHWDYVLYIFTYTYLHIFTIFWNCQIKLLKYMFYCKILVQLGFYFIWEALEWYYLQIPISDD